MARGRAKLPKDAAQKRVIACRVSRQEEQEIEKAARKRKQRKAAWMRSVLLNAARQQVLEAGTTQGAKEKFEDSFLAGL